MGKNCFGVQGKPQRSWGFERVNRNTCWLACQCWRFSFKGVCVSTVKSGSPSGNTEWVSEASIQSFEVPWGKPALDKKILLLHKGGRANMYFSAFFFFHGRKGSTVQCQNTHVNWGTSFEKLWQDKELFFTQVQRIKEPSCFGAWVVGGSSYCITFSVSLCVISYNQWEIVLKSY